MKRAILFLVLGLIDSRAFAATRITVDQLNKEIAASKGQSDSKIAGHLSSIQLTERLGATELTSMEAALPGPESRQALVILADQAAFLALPPAEIPTSPPPSFADQRAIIGKAIEYVRAMQLRIPNLIATRDTIHFEDSPPGLKVGTAGGGFNAAQPLHPVSRTTVTVSYRSGKDFIQVVGKEQPASLLNTRGLSSFGEFGSILSTVLIDLPQGKLAWSHWEQRAAKPVAVFSFSVPKAASHYAVRFCCVGMRPLEQFSSYHGEMTINPVDGTILRLTIMADLAREDPMTRADLMVEYRPVELGGKTYFCPAKSIAVSLAMDQATFRGTMSLGTGTVNYRALAIADAPKQLMLNEVVFDRYHLFQSDARLLTTDNSTPPTIPDAVDTPNAAAPSGSAPIAVPLKAETIAPAAAPAGSSATGMEIANAAAPSIAVATPLATISPAPIAPATPEIRVTPQQVPAIPDVPLDQATFSLRVTSRIVDVSVSAFDKKGRPVTNLTRDDFDIADGGRKQSLRSFSRTAAATSPAPVTAHSDIFSNHPEASDNSGQTAASATAASITIIFFDATSLQFNDLTYARDQVLKIIKTLAPSEPVGIYLRIGFGYRVLLEPTTDRTALSASLGAWKPNARDLARAQEAEQRNRQQFDTLRNPGAVMSTYAMVGGAGGGGPMIGSDPQLFNLGEEPTREALSVLVAVATHMGVMPGHKNLVWIASDNVLADWSDQSASGDEGRMSPNSIGLYSIRTQEALNNAHVSLYPIDASQLETDATDASLQNDGVQLDPSVKDNYPGFKAPPGGRSLTQLRTQTHPVQVAVQKLAESTGGRAFGRSSNLISNLNRVIEDSNAVYLLSFAPDTQPDDKYHQLRVTLPSRRNVNLRYRTGYLYSKEPASLKERFAQVLWQPFDASEIAITARRLPATGGTAIALNIAAGDIGLQQRGDRRTGKLDVFLVMRDDTGAGAMVKEQTLALDLSQDTYNRFVREGIPFQQYIDGKQGLESVRMIVVDESSGRFGSITIPSEIANAKP
jgi:VWFA-related protein